ncbi:hypothetical protein [Undibacterium rugosum]|uniref:Uncharacterized protein n=1 Tax=Undibacterium rugosum TaxID=2762291 RepID=A0A923I0Y7_9BURK|nr:hypothetical protein [Undibacterium rugosum]MBC3934467.1 hypothetical protein [Undibacterium rugosum]MBR7777082.1 hypothetical protein [Undibacterium rugosum]
MFSFAFRFAASDAAADVGQSVVLMADAIQFARLPSICHVFDTMVLDHDAAGLHLTLFGSYAGIALAI